MVSLEVNAHQETTVQRAQQTKLLVQEVLLNLETDQMSVKIALKVSIALLTLTHLLSVLMDIVQQTVNHQLCAQMELMDQLILQE